QSRTTWAGTVDSTKQNSSLLGSIDLPRLWDQGTSASQPYEEICARYLLWQNEHEEVGSGIQVPLLLVPNLQAPLRGTSELLAGNEIWTQSNRLLPLPANRTADPERHDQEEPQ